MVFDAADGKSGQARHFGAFPETVRADGAATGFFGLGCVHRTDAQQIDFLTAGAFKVFGRLG